MMKTIHKILVPTDFSETADHATQHAIQLAKAFDSSVTLLHVRTIFHDDPVALDAELKEAETHLQDKAREIGDDTIEIKTLVDRGISASEGILDLLSDQDFDLVAMGTHGRSKLAHFLLGSVAEAVVREAPCPVLSVRPDADVKKEGYRKILVGFDFSDSSRNAVRHAAEMSRKLGAALEVIYVFEQQIHPAYYPIWDEMALKLIPEIQSDANTILKEICSAADLKNWTLKVSHARWKAHQEIVEYARTRDIDLIVLGTHGFSGLDHFLLGSTSERVLRSAHCPVLTLKLSDRESVDKKTSKAS